MRQTDFLKIHSNKIMEHQNKMNADNYLEVLSEIYKYIKSVTNLYFDNNKMHWAYDFLKNYVIGAEQIYRNIKLINVTAKFYNNIQDISLIEYIVNCTRKYLIEDIVGYYVNDNYERYLKSFNPTNKCHKAATHIKQLCSENNIECYIIPVYPGYDKTAELYDGNGYHFFNIIRYNNRYYLIDVTYLQFFYTVKNNLDRLGIINISGCNPGVFMLMSKRSREIATTLLENGYIKLTEEILKIYLDAFTISFRNGLYYEYTNDFSYITDYTVNDYIKFLRGEDSQINHENKEYLGYQKKPLNNYKFNFKPG